MEQFPVFTYNTEQKKKKTFPLHILKLKVTNYAFFSIIYNLS